MKIRLRKLYQRIRYRKQLKKGFGLLSDLGEKKVFTLVNGKMFIMNGVDPMVKVDLHTHEATKCDGGNYVITYEYKVKAIDD